MTQISKQALIVENNQSFPNNNNGAITPSELRGFNVDMIDSTVNQTVYTTDSGSWNVGISNLNAFTASQQPSFTSLNSFTASQLVINSGVNTYTQSANGRLTALENETANLEAFTASINQIQSNGTVLGTSTRFNLVGPGTFFSASIVQNVGGPIATLTFTSDNAKLNTSSFNDYTASTAATQSLFSASVATYISQSSATFSAFSSSQNSFNLSATASIVELLNLSSSLSGGYATQGELDQSASVLQANIDTKLNTSSFNAYTQSINSFTSSGVFGLGFATTGSNTFVGNQNITGNAVITGSLLVSGSQVNDVTVIGNIFVTGSVGGNRTTISSGSVRVGSGSTAVSFMAAGNLICTNFDGTQFQQISLENNEGTLQLSIDGNGSYISDYDPNTSDYSKAIKFQSYSDYGVGQVQVLRPLQVTGSVSIGGNLITSGSVTITGSVYGNVRGITISSNTASIDLSVSNFFTLTLVSGSTTHLTATNIRPGQTINLLVAQPSVGTGSVSYSTSIFDFPAGANYIPTPITGSKDIISFISFDSSILYATSINNLA